MVLSANQSSGALIEEGGLATSFTRATEAQALALAEAHYGLRASALRYDTEKDDTFRLDTGTARYVLKIANPDETAGELDFQFDVLAHIARQDPGLPAPRLVATRRGERRVAWTDAAGQRRWVRLLTYLEGSPLSELDSTGEERARVGEMLARLRLAMAGLSHPGGERMLAWDVKHLLRLADLAEGIRDPRQRRLIDLGLQRYAELEPQLRLARSQILHNDFSRSNIVVDRKHPGFVTGIIDFGDCVRTLIAIDVATALLNQLPAVPQDDLFLQGRSLLRGYLRVADLTDLELALIPHLVMARVIARALITTWRADQFPDNATYIMRNTPPGWAQLAWFLARTPDEAAEALLAPAA